jgi:6-phosphogluconolactonase (cycloisomerase 2 family)
MAQPQAAVRHATSLPFRRGTSGLLRLAAGAALSFALAACGSRSEVSGTLSGLTTGTGISVVLQDNGGDALTLTGNGPFIFAKPIAAGAAYHVTVQAQPHGQTKQTCTVSKGTGTVGSRNVTGISVGCVANPQFAYVANMGDNTVSAYRINATTGALTAVPGSPFAAGNGPISVAVNPAGTFVYVANEGGVWVYRIDASTGALTAVPGSPLAAGNNTNSVAVNPAGTFVYVANEGDTFNDGTVSAYRINASTGALTAVPGSPFATGGGSSSVTVNPEGTFAYVTNIGDPSNDGTVSAYRINASTGALTAVPGSPFATGSDPTSVAVNPAGTVAYVANWGDGTVSVYRMNASTGALTPVPGSPFAAGRDPVSVTVNPAGIFAYVANWYDDTVSAYRINASTGALTAVPGSPFAAEIDPSSVTVNPAGTFAYVANGGDHFNYISDNTVSAYRINASTGVLTAVPGSPFAAGSDPTSVAVAQP